MVRLLGRRNKIIENGLYRQKSKNLIVDTVDELHEFAQIIGLKRNWFQEKPNKPHYDVKGMIYNIGLEDLVDKFEKEFEECDSIYGPDSGFDNSKVYYIKKKENVKKI